MGYRVGWSIETLQPGMGRKLPGHLAGIGDGLQLQGRQDPAVRGGQGKGVSDVRWWDTGQCAGLHNTVWVLLPNLGWRGIVRGVVRVSAGLDQDGGQQSRVGEGAYQCFAQRRVGQTHKTLPGGGGGWGRRRWTHFPLHPLSHLNFGPGLDYHHNYKAALPPLLPGPLSLLQGPQNWAPQPRAGALRSGGAV